MAGTALVWPSFVCVWRLFSQHFSPAGLSSHVRHRGQLHILLGSGHYKGGQASSRTGRGTTQHHGGRGWQEGNRCGAAGSNAHLGEGREKWGGANMSWGELGGWSLAPERGQSDAHDVHHWWHPSRPSQSALPCSQPCCSHGTPHIGKQVCALLPLVVMQPAGCIQHVKAGRPHSVHKRPTHETCMSTLLRTLSDHPTAL